MDITKNDVKIKEYRDKAKELVSKMTLEEKVSQMLHSAPAIERLQIPAYNWWNESLHGVARSGVATMFPQAIGLAAMFDEDMMEEIGNAIATEARAKYNMQKEYGDTDIYKGLTFWAPNVNIFRDPRWGRGHETYGEDPFLTSLLGKRFVVGLQGHDDEHLFVAACAKHFAVHSGPEDIRHSFNATASKKDMAETYLPAFKALVTEAKVETVMGAYNRTNGEPCCGSKTLLKDILRDKWGFDGHVVSDCWAIKDFHEGHKVTDSEIESVALAVNNGCDINCGNIFINLVDAVKDGLVKEERIDEAVTNLFTTRYKLGIMGDEKTKYDEISYFEVDSKKMRELNLKAARKSIVLLKNDNVLPLNLNNIKTIGVIGPNADNRRALKGNYEGTASRYVTVLEGIEDYVAHHSKDEVRVLYSEGCQLFRDRVEFLAQSNDRISEVKGICDRSDVIVACFGLDSGLEGEEGDQGNAYASGDKPSLNLPGIQEEVIKTIVASGKPVVLVIMAGSALNLKYESENIGAILNAWYPGALGGRAVAETIFGDNNPQGKLPLTFYEKDSDLPEFTDYSMENRTYRYYTGKPVYSFGYGLSYTDFEFKNLTKNFEKPDDKDKKLSFQVTNIGEYDGVATAEVYIKALDKEAPLFSLKAVAKVELKKGESKNITIELDDKAFMYADENGEFKFANGGYEIYVSDFLPDENSMKLLNKKALELKL